MVHAQVSFRGANVNPVSAGWHMGEESFLSFQQLRKQTILKRMVLASGNQIQHFRLENIGAGVDRIASNLLGFWLFQKPADTAVAFSFYQTVGGGILHWS